MCFRGMLGKCRWASFLLGHVGWASTHSRTSCLCPRLSTRHFTSSSGVNSPNLLGFRTEAPIVPPFSTM